MKRVRSSARKLLVINCIMLILTSCTVHHLKQGKIVKFNETVSVYLAVDKMGRHSRAISQHELDIVLATAYWDIPQGVEIIEKSVTVKPSEVFWHEGRRVKIAIGPGMDFQFKGRMKIQPWCPEGENRILFMIPGILNIAAASNTTPMFKKNSSGVYDYRLPVYMLNIHTSNAKVFWANLGRIIKIIICVILGLIVLSLISPRK